MEYRKAHAPGHGQFMIMAKASQNGFLRLGLYAIQMPDPDL